MGRGIRVRPRTRASATPRTLFLLAAVTPSLFGCQMIGGGSKEPGGPEAYPTEDPVYQGFLEMDGGRVEAALELIHEGRRRVRGALQGASGLMADGEGVLRGETLSLLLTYGGTCPGRMELEGVWDREARVFAGAVEASDCTGPGQGTFHFSAGNRPGFSSLARR